MWKKLNCYNIREGKYMININGEIRNEKGKILKTRVSNSGYERVGLRTNIKGEVKWFSVHRLVCKTFKLFTNKEKVTVNHKDGNKLHNHIDNLEWSSYSENNKHAHATGLNFAKHGICNGMNKYPVELVEDICKLLEKGYTNKEIRNTIDISIYVKDNIRKLLFLINNVQRLSKVTDVREIRHHCVSRVEPKHV